MEPVTVHFKLTQEEWVAAYRKLLMRSGLMRVAAIVSVVAVVYPVLMSLLYGFGLGYGLKLLASVWWFVLVTAGLYYYIISVSPRRFYRADRRFRDAATYTFAEDHFTCRGKFIESKVDWGLYTGVREDEKMYLLIYGQEINAITPIPKRAFRSKRDEQAFRAIVFPRFDRKLEGRIGEGAALPEDDYTPPEFQPPDWR